MMIFTTTSYFNSCLSWWIWYSFWHVTKYILQEQLVDEELPVARNVPWIWFLPS